MIFSSIRRGSLTQKLQTACVLKVKFAKNKSGYQIKFEKLKSI